MTQRRKGLLRGVGVLAGMLLAAGAISPAFSAFTPTKAKIKKIATKVLKNKIDDFGNPLFIQETELVRTPMFTLTDGQSRVILTHGPFTITADCDLDAAGQDIARILIATTQDNSSFDASDEADDLDAATPDTERDWGAQVNVAANTLEVEDQTGVAIAPDGTTLVLVGSLTLTNRTPDTCGFAAAHLLA